MSDYYTLNADNLGGLIMSRLKPVMDDHAGWFDKFDLYEIDKQDKFLLVMTYNKIQRSWEVPARTGLEFESVMNEVSAWISLAKYTKKSVFKSPKKAQSNEAYAQAIGRVAARSGQK